MNYHGWEQYSESVRNDEFSIHSHDEYEIFMFLEGNAEYMVEGNTYDLEPNDIMIIRKHEMHRIYHKGNGRYGRFILMVSPEFFGSFPEYEEVFLKSSPNKGSKINAEIVHSSGLYDAIIRYKKYSDGMTKRDIPIVDSVMTEILHILSSISDFTAGEVKNKQVKQIISYINKHCTEELSLEALTEKFYISKYHLCHMFKKETGVTVQQYIRQKRLLLVNELRRDGLTLTEAALRAGFGDYSSFYRAYTNMYNVPPKSEISWITHYNKE